MADFLKFSYIIEGGAFHVYFNNTYPDTLLWFTPNCHQDIDI